MAGFVGKSGDTNYATEITQLDHTSKKSNIRFQEIYLYVFYAIAEVARYFLSDSSTSGI